MREYVQLVVVIWFACAASCGFPRPTPFGTDAGDDGGGRLCMANQALRCNAGDLVRCNSEGTGEVSESCSLGCSAVDLRCHDVNPSNGLALQLDMTAGEPDLDLGTTATINTDDGTVLVDGKPAAVKSTTIAQAPAPTIRVFLVHSLTTADVTITGGNALAFVSNADVTIAGVFSASALASTTIGGPRPGPGGFNDGTCQGGKANQVESTFSGAGGGAFGGAGGRGGSATNDDGTATGAAGGTTTGNPTLVPLRGGCDSGAYSSNVIGFGGGAIQLVSRTKIAVSGVVAANGSGGSGGGSGGGLLLEAPIVEVSGSVVANGAAGAGGCPFPPPGESGRLDAKPASGGVPCPPSNGVNGGNGGAGTANATGGASISLAGTNLEFGGHGGGGVGRIRINTVAGGLHTTGLFSPNPSTGPIGSR